MAPPLQVGRAKSSATTGSVVNLEPRSGQLLGFWANATATCVIYDDSTTAGLNQQVSIAACNVGWNPLPLDLINGLSVNQSAQLYFVFA